MRESFLRCALLLSAQLTAQLQPAGTSLGTSTTTVTRGGVGNGTGELLQRFDADQLHGFGAMRRIQAFRSCTACNCWRSRLVLRFPTVR